MTIDESIRALHESALVQGVNIESLHSSCAELHASAAQQGKNIDSLLEAVRTMLFSINNLALLSESQQRRISTLEEGGGAQ